MAHVGQEGPAPLISGSELIVSVFKFFCAFGDGPLEIGLDSAQSFLLFFDRSRHRIEGTGKARQFIAASELDPVIEVTLAEGVCAFL